MQKKFLAVCFLAGVLGTVSLQAMDKKKRKSIIENRWKQAGYTGLKYLSYGTGVNTLFQVGYRGAQWLAPKFAAGVSAKVGALQVIPCVGPILCKALTYWCGFPLFTGFVVVTLAYKACVLKKSIFPNLACGSTDDSVN